MRADEAEKARAPIGTGRAARRGAVRPRRARGRDIVLAGLDVDGRVLVALLVNHQRTEGLPGGAVRCTQ